MSQVAHTLSRLHLWESTSSWDALTNAENSLGNLAFIWNENNHHHTRLLGSKAFEGLSSYFFSSHCNSCFYTTYWFSFSTDTSPLSFCETCYNLTIQRNQWN